MLRDARRNRIDENLQKENNQYLVGRSNDNKTVSTLFNSYSYKEVTRHSTSYFLKDGDTIAYIE